MWLMEASIITESLFCLTEKGIFGHTDEEHDEVLEHTPGLQSGA